MTKQHLICCLAILVAAVGSQSAPAQDDVADWPKIITTDEATITMYQPQIDSWEDNVVEARAAVSVAGSEGGTPVFGAVWLTSHFSTDYDTRTVRFRDVRVPMVRFPEATEEQQAKLIEILETEIPKWQLETDLDRILPALELSERDEVKASQLKNEPPQIIIRHEPAVLVLIDGEPKLQDVEGSKLQRVVNTPFVIVKTKADFYLVSGETWYHAVAATGPWTITKKVPKHVRKYADQLEIEAPEENSEDGRIPQIVVSTKPAELIFIDGKPEFTPLESNEVMVVSNTDSDLVFDIPSQSYYVLLSGRWFSTKELDGGPWAYVANDELPDEFTDIPAESEVGYLRASIAGTDESKEALLEQSVPQTAAVATGEASVSVQYDGTPEFKQVEGTDFTYAVNTGSAVFLIGGSYYLCEQGVWYVSPKPTGTWKVCSDVPDEIYTIPPSNPHYNVTYVYVYESKPEVVYVGYTPGYTGSYISHGCVVYGTGWYYHPWWGPRYYYPYHWTWGFHVRYNPWYGWSFGLSYSNGPFRITIGSGGYRGGYWGPGFYRPYPVPYGAAYRAGYRRGYQHGRYDGRRPSTRPIQVNNVNIYNRTSNRANIVNTRDRASAARPSVARDRANNVFTDRNGNVYRRNRDGSWDRRGQGNWSKVERPATTDRPVTRDRPTTRQRPTTRDQKPSVSPRPSAPSTLERDFRARQRGSARYQQYGSRGRPSTMNRPSPGARPQRR